MHDSEITVLLIEDNPSDALLVKYIIDEIEWLPIKLLNVTNLTKAFTLLKEKHVDLILLDLMLPDSSDRFTFSKLFAVNNQLPVVVLSGIDDKDVALDAIKEGAQDYLVKGEFDAKLLERTMRYAIERSKLALAQKKVQQELQAQDRLLKLITNISATFINLSSEQIDQAIENALQGIGEFLQADKAFILELSEKDQEIQNYYEWASNQIHADTRFFESISPATFTSVLHHLHENSLIRCLNVDELPEEFTELRLALQVQRVQSFMMVALFYKRQVTAILGLATISRPGNWSSETISLLNTSGEVFYRAIKKKQSEERIKESERKYRTLVESLDEGLIYVDDAGKIQFANGSMCAMIGYSHDELIGKNLMHDIFKNNNHINSKNGVLNLIQSRHDLLLAEQYELLIKKKDGEKIWVIMNNHPIVDESGKKIASMGTLVNITDRKKAEERLKQANEDLRTFIYRASHDLRGPLASVLGITNLASMEITDTRALQYFGYINQSTHKLDKTLKALIDVATITQPDEAYSQIEFEQLLKEVISTFTYTNSLETLSVDLEVKQEYPFISNKQLLIYIFEKLIENAVAFRKEDEREPRLLIKVNVGKRETVIEIDDNGEGIPKEWQPKVFHMFFKGSEKSRGSGLGLYIVDKLVSRLNGSISVISQKDAGTKFKICLKNL